MKDRLAQHNKRIVPITLEEMNRQRYADVGLPSPAHISIEGLRGNLKVSFNKGIPMTNYPHQPIDVGCYSETKEGNPCKAHPVKGTHQCVGHSRQGD